MATKGELVVAGVRSPYFEVGNRRDREAVVFAHGNPGPASDWSDLLECAGEFARGIAMDFPGYGAADRPRHFDYSVDGYARHLDGALGELGVDRAHIVAHDFGGPWALEWAAGHPERFASATLINTGVLIGEAYLPLEQAELQRRAFPSARVVTLPGTGHWAMLERPGDVRDIVLPFLREQAAG